MLREDFRPALGCTEPACVAWAAATAAGQAEGEVRRVSLVVDPRMFKNCFAVGIPHSGGRSGIRWALALGVHAPDPSAGLEIFRQVDVEIQERAGVLAEGDRLDIRVDESRDELFVDVTVERGGGTGRAVVEEEHTRMVRLEQNGTSVPLTTGEVRTGGAAEVRRALTALGFEELVAMARDLTDEDRRVLRRGASMNLAISRHGLGLLPEQFTEGSVNGQQDRIGRLVCAGVFARMSGEDMVVMSVGGSGNKGIACLVPVELWAREQGVAREAADEALALSVLLTSASTHRLGALSAICGTSNAAGVGIAAGVVLLEGGGADEVSLAVTNMVGNLSGMICDGAKIGCGLKALTAVDAGFRAAFLALTGIGIPVTDGIVGPDGMTSLANLGRLARGGSEGLEREIIAIMQEKISS